MNSLTDLRDEVDVVIGVDTHVHTHSAAVVDTATGGVLEEITVEATAEGAELGGVRQQPSDGAGLGVELLGVGVCVERPPDLPALPATRD